MRQKNLKRRAHPLNLGEALATFGRLRTEHPDCVLAAKLGLRLVRELQHQHKVLRTVRATLPATHSDYCDPALVDAALARTTIEDTRP